MATQRRPGRYGLIVHSDRGTQFTSWAFTNGLRDSGIAPSMGAVGAAANTAMMESFWARLQVEVLNRRRWKTRIELATAIHDYFQFHNERRRHSSLQMRTPSEIELAWTTTSVAVVEPDLAKTASTVVVIKTAPLVSLGSPKQRSRSTINIYFSTTTTPPDFRRATPAKPGQIRPSQTTEQIRDRIKRYCERINRTSH